MPLDKSCDKGAVSRNISMLMKRERKPQKQAIAIALSVLKRACGMKDSGKRKTAKEIVGRGSREKRQVRENGDFIQHVVDVAKKPASMKEAVWRGNRVILDGIWFRVIKSGTDTAVLIGVESKSGTKHGHEGHQFHLYMRGDRWTIYPATSAGAPGFMDSDDVRVFRKRDVVVLKEEGFGLAGPPKIYNPNRVSVKRGPKLPVHRKYKKSIRSQPFLDPDDFVSVESLFREGQGPDFVAAQNPGRRLGLSPSASTTKKPTDRKRKKVRVAPSGKES